MLSHGIYTKVRRCAMLLTKLAFGDMDMITLEAKSITANVI